MLDGRAEGKVFYLSEFFLKERPPIILRIMLSYFLKCLGSFNVANTSNFAHLPQGTPLRIQIEDA